MGPSDFTIHVRNYRRLREGIIEHVRRHKRRPRRWYRRPR